MSFTIFEFARSFVAGRLTPESFSEAYIELWKIERDKNLLQLDEPSLSECLSSIFCVADMYESDESREDYELDGEMLRSEVARLLQALVAN
ncbi:colicin immunity domain-containing protein [Pseudomonas alliivorans]|nr:colicin immunity domain-containing protein [Pseudomonas alliivorans]MEE4714371.1 colicin immunity domain-containing protein [Pseudomonas alliivorans]MEE4729577.1 colicin immunity domain-containing protein [Pseudomonas alliivorans]MEE4770651.1 colicin immunity domain-containing protein [Pseudomonas alliivorans]MEE4817001.1 colicin immunity domain-containing protein [Pseudomonas alliivorans]